MQSVTTDRASATLRPMATRADVHRLVDEVPAARLDVVEQILRASVAGTVAAPPRTFASAGTLPDEHDLAERSEEIVGAVLGDGGASSSSST